MIMKKTLTIAALWILIIALAEAQDNQLENMLFELPDVIFHEIDPPGKYDKAYELQIKQMVDHGDPSAGYFYQKAYLSHKGFDRPTVMITEGYNMFGNYPYELTRLLDANQIAVEHRFFGASCPDTLDYKYLNLEQATADLHYVNTLFREIYRGRWLSTGVSKGGATTIFYRYFYPEDVDVSVPYVAPINKAFEDERIYHFLDTVGTDECRNKIMSLQKRMLKNRDKVLPMLEEHSREEKLSFTYLTFEEAFEYAVLEYSFSFWQYGSPCNRIPDKDTPLSNAVDYFFSVSDLGFFSDSQIERYGSHYYQSATEMGYYGYETEDFSGLLKALPLKPHPHATFMPGKLEVPFDGTLLKEVHEWLESEGHHIIYIYGGSDTWSATSVPPSDKVDALWFMLKGKNHGTANIRNMTKEERQAFISALERWLEMEIE